MNINELFHHISKQPTLVLTPNRRLSAYILGAYHAHQHQQGQRVWSTPEVLPLQAWFELCWQQLEDNGQASLPQLLNSHQALACWQRIIQKSTEGNELLKVQAAAQTAFDAWQILQQWQCSLEDPRLACNDDTSAFCSWAREYQHYSQQHSLCDSSTVPGIIKQHLAQLSLPAHIVLACFDELNPCISDLIQTLTHQQVTVTQFDTQCDEPQAQRMACQDSEDEMITMARWAKQQLIQGEKRIGCVIPNLNQQRQVIERVFAEVFAQASDINISAGQALADFPVIHQALLLLDLKTKKRLSLPQISQLLRSPFIADAEYEQAQRAQFDAKLHQHGELSLSVAQLIRWSSRYAPRFSQHLNDTQQLDSPKQASPSEWAQFISQYLALWRWPGERSLNSDEYQVVQRWLSLLSELASLDLIKPQVSFVQALQQLQQMAHNTQYQTQTSTAPVQVLGLLEAAGIPFDSLWVMGLDDENWPPTAKPNPFIALPLQRQLNMPHASAQRELEFCQRLTKRLASSAQDVILSHAQNEGDRQLRPSPLLSEFPIIPLEDITLAPYQSRATQLHASGDWEPYTDELGPTIDDAQTIKGGSAVIKYQASCPFRAFAALRLGAKRWQPGHLGLNALQRGILLHRALELIWQDIDNHQRLCELSPDALKQLLELHIVDTLGQFKKRYPNSLTHRYHELEKQRLHDVIMAWLDLEKQRPPFKVIAQEQQVEYTINNMTLTLRSDRIDQLASGEKIVIDYKTGLTNINAWFGERLEEPQLPLYSLCDEEISGLLLAQVRIDNMRFHGVTTSDVGIANVKAIAQVKHEEAASTWVTQANEWRQHIEQLAADFAAGIAKVDPKHAKLTCAQCDLSTLCRIQ